MLIAITGVLGDDALCRSASWKRLSDAFFVAYEKDLLRCIHYTGGSRPEGNIQVSRPEELIALLSHAKRDGFFPGCSFKHLAEAAHSMFCLGCNVPTLTNKLKDAP